MSSSRNSTSSLGPPSPSTDGHAPMPACAGGESALLALASCRPAAPSWVERARRRLPVLLIAGFSAAGRWQASGPTHGPGNPSPWGNAILGFLAFLAQNSSCVSVLKPGNPRQKKGGYYSCTLVLLILWGARAQVEDEPRGTPGLRSRPVRFATVSTVEKAHRPPE